MTRFYGRRPRAFDPAIPHMSALRMGAPAPAPIPTQIDYTSPLPADLGMMLNDQLGDCTMAGLGHAIEIWSRFAGGAETVVSDDAIRRACTEFNASNGAVEQTVLRQAMNAGFPLDAAGDARSRLTCFVELDPRQPEDIRRAIYECGVVYLGINVPQALLNGEPPAVWDAGSPASNEGHCIIAAGYDTRVSGNLTRIVSWGRRYDLTDAFIAAYVDEAYALVSPLWVEKTGSTPLGMTLVALEAQALGLRGSA